MKKTLILAVALLTVASMASAALEDLGTWSPNNYADSSTLHITRDGTFGGIWTWAYELFNDNAADATITQFSVGLIVDDTPSGTGSGHYYNYSAQKWDPVNVAWQAMATTIVETSTHGIWYDFALADGEKARFVFDTDLQWIGVANHQARDTIYSPDWQFRPTPAPAIPEASTIMLAMMGLSSVAGLRRLRAS